MRAACPVLLAALALPACAGSGLHPAAPLRSALPAVTDAAPSNVVLHLRLSDVALQQMIDQKLPRTGKGQVTVLGRAIAYDWSRTPVSVQFSHDQIKLGLQVVGRVQMLGEHRLPIDVTISAEPVITSDYQAVLQSTSVEVKGGAPLDVVNHAIEARVRDVIAGRLDGFRVDLRPMVEKAWARLARPIPLESKRSFIGTGACAELKVVAVQAAPTMLAMGIEKDIALVVVPSVSMPCALDPNAPPPPLPLLANVPAVRTGPFEVTVPITARYEEFAKALENAVGEKLQFSARYPDVFLQKPEVYPSDGALIIKFHVGGFVRIAGIQTDVKGEVYFTGHPRVVDNQLLLPDLTMTPGTADALVHLKLYFDHERLLDRARSKLRVDLGERLQLVHDKLTAELPVGDGKGCMRGRLLRMEITGLHLHDTFARTYVKLTAQAALYVPCPR
jgi:hypothetical protein